MLEPNRDCRAQNVLDKLVLVAGSQGHFTVPGSESESRSLSRSDISQYFWNVSQICGIGCRDGS